MPKFAYKKRSGGIGERIKVYKSHERHLKSDQKFIIAKKDPCIKKTLFLWFKLTDSCMQLGFASIPNVHSPWPGLLPQNSL
jgi:hypothetical protein